MGASFLQGSVVKLLKNAIKFKSNGQIIYGATDPTAVAVDAAIGSLYLCLTNGKLYVKQDSGLSTNWYDGAKVLSDFIATKGQPNGIAPLDAGGKVSTTYLPSSIVNGLKFKGTWDALTNTPALASGVGNIGDIYIVSVAGTTDLDGATDWNVGDWAVFSDSNKWEQIDNTDMVISVNGKSGVVVLTHADLTSILGTGEYHFSADEHDCLIGVEDQMTGILLGPVAGIRSRIRQSATDRVQVESEVGSGVGITAAGPNAAFSPDTVYLTTSAHNIALNPNGTVKVSAADYETNIDDDTLTTGKYVDDAIALALWSTQVIDSSMSPYTVTGSKTFYILDTSSGDVTVLLPNISTALSGSENRFIKSSNLNKAVVTTVGGVDLVGSKTSQYIWEDNRGFSVVMSSGIGEYVITQDNRNVDTFETPVGVWAKTSSIEHWNLAISTLGTGATFTGNNHGATLTTGTTASTIYSHEVSTEELISNQNYFAFVTSCSTAGIFDLVAEGWNGSAWSEVGALVKPFEAGTALNGSIPFFKTGYTKWRLKLTNSGTTASLTCTIARGEWADERWKSVQYNGGSGTGTNGGATRKKKEFLTAGSHTFTVPDGVNEVKVILAGGGSGVSKTMNSTLTVSCGGGCGESVIRVPSGAILSISAGSGGTISGAALTLGGKGGDSSLTIGGVPIVAAGINRQDNVDKAFFIVQNNAISLYSSDMSDDETYSVGGRANVPTTSSGYALAARGQGGPSFKPGSVYGTGGAGGGIVAATGSTGANGGAIIYYDLPSLATDPNNGVDA